MNQRKKTEIIDYFKKKDFVKVLYYLDLNTKIKI